MAKKKQAASTHQQEIAKAQKVIDSLSDLIPLVTDLAIDNGRLEKELAAAQAKLKEAGIV